MPATICQARRARMVSASFRQRSSGTLLLSFGVFSADLGNIAVGKLEHRRLPPEQPVVAVEQLALAHLPHHDVADPRLRSRQPIDAALASRHFPDAGKAFLTDL